MGGGVPQPERPKRQRSRDPGCARYVSGGVAHFLGGSLFGLPFFCGGLLCLATLIAGLLGLSGPLPDNTLANRIIGCLGMLLIGSAHAIVGFLMIRWAFVSPEWLVIDREHGVLTKQTGVLGFRRFAKPSLSDFSDVSIFPVTSKWTVRENFDVALLGPNDIRFSIGRVTLSADLAREYGREVATFLNLPLS